MALLESYIAQPLSLYETEQGGIRVEGTRVSLDTVIAYFNQGYSAEDLVRSSDTLKLRDVYAVIAWGKPASKARGTQSRAGASKHTGLNPRALKGQAPTCVGEEGYSRTNPLPAKAGNCFFKARGFSPVYLPVSMSSIHL